MKEVLFVKDWLESQRKKIKVRFESIPVTDLHAYHSIDAEKELTNMLMKELEKVMTPE